MLTNTYTNNCATLTVPVLLTINIKSTADLLRQTFLITAIYMYITILILRK